MAEKIFGISDRSINMREKRGRRCRVARQDESWQLPTISVLSYQLAYYSILHPLQLLNPLSVNQLEQ